MWSYRAERLVDGERVAVRRAIDAVVEQHWGDRSRTVLDADDLRIDAVSTDPSSIEADVWLSWSLADRGHRTLVGLRLDELSPGPDPSESLVSLLASLDVGDLLP